jgi:hypothetical protein
MTLSSKLLKYFAKASTNGPPLTEMKIFVRKYLSIKYVIERKKEKERKKERKRRRKNDRKKERKLSTSSCLAFSIKYFMLRQ